VESEHAGARADVDGFGGGVERYGVGGGSGCRVRIKAEVDHPPVVATWWTFA
jgi:hypothetical protein